MIHAPNGDTLVLILDDRSAILVHIYIIRCAENSDDRGELLLWCLAGHVIPEDQFGREIDGE